MGEFRYVGRIKNDDFLYIDSDNDQVGWEPTIHMVKGIPGVNNARANGRYEVVIQKGHLFEWGAIIKSLQEVYPGLDIQSAF